MRDYYKVMGLQKGATDEEIKAAYRKLMLIWHPDKNMYTANATEMVQMINEANEVLSDPVRKGLYDSVMGKSGVAHTLVDQRKDSNQSLISTHQIDLLVGIQKRIVPIEEVIDHPRELLNYYLNELDEVRCCTIQLGFSIKANGKRWFESVDEYEMAKSWFIAIEDVLHGATKTTLWAWEESGMTMLRFGDVIEVQDVHGRGDVVAERVFFDMPSFVKDMIFRGRQLIKLTRGVIKELRAIQKNSEPLPKDFLVRKRAIDHEFSDDLEAIIEDIETKFSFLEKEGST